ncbi:GTPase HflX [Treponema parvum]|uniref:GTPase HflX n=1 Tax=Treponema parvum TaxID=138851 RepID=A0A975F0M7_9SPIR|nr:GTPase HflX [Treponema parvum]QTQ12319.1 GTPase HflX [Treponema parvum]
MIEIRQEEERKTQCFLVGSAGGDLSELESLISTLEMNIAGKTSLVRPNPTPAYGMGIGKVREIIQAAEEAEADCIIFDFTIDPTKQRNWEKLAKKPVFDRQEVILRIFAKRAETREASLQVELARLEYSLPRLAHSYGDLSRQRGGNYGSKGSGETQLELDQRGVRLKIRQLKKELEKVVQNRDVQRKRREKFSMPVCALTGYTNAGKSSLMNALTGAGVFVENKLFATLDPTTRRLAFKNGSHVLLSDTVGFISSLPHSLVNAFKSTLEEAARADLLLLVLDASDENIKNQYDTCINVLEEIGAAKKPRIVALNKIDCLENEDLKLSALKINFPDASFISAKTGQGLEDLLETIRNRIDIQLMPPYTDLK